MTPFFFLEGVASSLCNLSSVPFFWFVLVGSVIGRWPIVLCALGRQLSASSQLREMSCQLIRYGCAISFEFCFIRFLNLVLTIDVGDCCHKAFRVSPRR